MARRDDVAALVGVPIERVQPATAEELRRAYADSASAVVVDVATQEPATYWRVGTRYYLDDPYFGDVVAIDDLRYDGDLGLHHKDLGVCRRRETMASLIEAQETALATFREVNARYEAALAAFEAARDEADRRELEDEERRAFLKPARIAKAAATDELNAAMTDLDDAKRAVKKAIQ